MSFILDALKKSESDRQRQSGPALFEVRVAPPRTRLPLWAIAIALLLVVNLGVVMWMLLRHQGHASASTGAPGASGAVTAASAPPLPGTPAAGTAVPVITTSAAASPGGAPPAALAAAPVAAPAAVPAAAPSAATTATTTAATAPAAAPAGAGTVTSAPDSTNAEDYAPAVEPSSASGLSNHVRRGTASGVPLYQDVTATPGTQLPQLRLDLHVFAARAQDRFVMINMHKLREGDSLPEGVHVDSITPEGAVLSFNGTRFLLPRD
jgi:general secretion pathway protein B